MKNRAWLMLMMAALFLSTTAEDCPGDDEGDGGVTEDGGEDGGDGGHNANCPLMAGTYTITGECPATSCTIVQEVNDCFGSVSCQTTIGALGSDTFIDPDGTFTVSAVVGSCTLVGQDTGFFSGVCNDLIGIDSCSISGTRN